MDASLESVAVNDQGPVFTSALRAAIARVPLWLLCSAATGSLALLAALPSFRWFRATTAHAYEPGSQLATLDQAFRSDQASALVGLAVQAQATLAVLGALSILLDVFFAGGWLQVLLERAEGLSVRRFLFGGARYFWRFARVLLLSVVLLGLASWVFFDKPWEQLVLARNFGVVGGELESLDSELLAVQLGWLQSAAYLLAFALILCWGDYTRTRLALHETRSALAAGASTFFVMLRHPIRTLWPMLLLSGVESIVLVVAGLAVGWLQNGLAAGSGWLRVVLIGVPGVVALVWGKIVRGARYSAAVRVSRDVVSPLSRPDPWSQRVGGPGGPQYPLGGDEYGVSL